VNRQYPTHERNRNEISKIRTGFALVCEIGVFFKKGGGGSFGCPEEEVTYRPQRKNKAHG